MSSLNISWSSFVSFPCVLSLVPRRRDQHLHLHFTSLESCREQRGGEICMTNYWKTIWTVKRQSMIEKIQCRLLLFSHCKVFKAEIYSLTSVHFYASVILETAWDLMLASINNIHITEILLQHLHVTWETAGIQNSIHSPQKLQKSLSLALVGSRVDS